MAFWNINSNFSMVSATEKAMDRENFTLQDLLDTEDILKEVLVPNTRVIEYLCQPQIISELVDYAIAPEYKSPAERDAGDSPVAVDTHTDNDTERRRGDSSAEDTKHPDEERASSTAPRSPVADTAKPRSGYEPGTSTSFHDHAEHDSGDGSPQLSNSDNDTLDASDQDFEEERLKHVRYAKLSSEILTTDVWTLLDALLSNDEAMHKLWSILEPEHAPLSTQQLSTFTKIVESLLEKRLDGMLDFIRTLPHFVDYFIRYIECQPLVDFLIKVISTDHPDNPTDIIDLLCDQQLIPKMIGVLGPDVSHSAQIAAGDFLKAFVNISGGNKSDICAIGPNELSRQFVSEECISELVRLMLFGGHGMCVAVTVIIEIIRKNNSDYDLVEVMQTTLESHPPQPRDNIYLGTMVKLFARAIPQFQAMLVAPETRTIQMPFGKVKPLGFERFRICELYAELLHCSNMNLLNDPMGEQVIKERDERRMAVHGRHRASKAAEPEPEIENSPSSNSKPEAATKAGASHGDHDSDMSRSSSDSDLGDDDDDDDDDDDEDDDEDEEDGSPSAYAPESSPPLSPSLPRRRNQRRDDEKEEESSEETKRSEAGRDASIDVDDNNDNDEDEDTSRRARRLRRDNSPDRSDHDDDEEPVSPLMSPSPPTPEDESGEELEYVEGERPKIAISALRNEELEAALEEERLQLQKNPVVGDQLKIALDENGCITAVIRMLFEFPWNNFLHNVVFDIVQQVFNGHIDHGYNKFLAIHMFTRDNITERIVGGQRENDKHERERHIRLGYVGHLTLISEEVVKFESVFEPDSLSPRIATALLEDSWIEYVHNDLFRLREQYNTVLGKVSMVGEEDEAYDEQEQERQRIMDMELDVIDSERGRLGAPARSHLGDNPSDSDSDSDSDDEVTEEAVVSEDEHDEDDNEHTQDDEGDALALQKHRSGGHGDEPDLMDSEEIDLKGAGAKQSSQFSRYLSHQLADSAGNFESGFSDEDDDSNEAWVPVSQDTGKQT